MSKLRVGVLMGGRSIEKEVSFNSGRTVCDHLDSFRYDVIPLFQRSNGALYILPWRFLHRGKISDFECRLDTQAQKISWDKLKDLVDFVYIAMHGKLAEDGTVQGFLEVLGIPYLGSKVLASALGMDKVAQKKILKAHGIEVPRGVDIMPELYEQYINNPDQLLEFVEQACIPLPWVIKPTKGGSSLGVSVIHTVHELLPAYMRAARVDETTVQAALIEEYLKGMEFSCIVITDYKTGTKIPLPPTEIVPETEFYDYEQKYMPGRATKFTPARCASSLLSKIQEVSVKAMEALGMENLGRIDGFALRNGSIVITDPNTLSGMAPSSYLFKQAAEINMSHTELINHLIETELSAYGMLNQLCDTEKREQRTMTTESKKRIALLMGGKSHEKEISLESGRNVLYKLSPHKYIPVPLFVDNTMQLYHLNQRLLVCNSTKEITTGLDSSMKLEWNQLPEIADFVFIGLHGGEGENGSVQGMLEMLGLPYNGSSILASALCMDKFKTAHFLKNQGFEVPASYLLSETEWGIRKQESIKKLHGVGPFPLIVKPHDDGCSVLVAKAKNEQELDNAIEAIFADGKKYALIEEYVAGMELTVGIIGNHTPQALPPSRAVAASDILTIEEKFLPGAGENQTPAPLPTTTLEFVQRTVEAAYKEINCKGYARIDCFYQDAHQSPTGKERVVFLEFNTLPGLTPATCIFHQAAETGMKPMEFIDLIIQLGFEEHTHVVPYAKEHAKAATSSLET